MKVRGTLEFSDDGRNWRPAHESEIAETMIFVKLRDGRELTFGGDNLAAERARLQASLGSRKAKPCSSEAAALR